MFSYQYVPKMSISRAVCWLMMLSMLMTVCMYYIYLELYGQYLASPKRVTSSKHGTSTSPHTDHHQEKTTDFRDLVAQFESQFKSARFARQLRINVSCELTDKVCHDQCLFSTPSSFVARLHNLINSPKLTLTSDQREAILTMSQSIPESKHIFVSAVDSRHATAVGDMIRLIHKFSGSFLVDSSVVVFDIGLTQEQRQELSDNRFCFLVKFRSDLFPAHVGENDCMSWKPLILLACIQKAKHLVVFQDARLKWTKYMNIALSNGMSRGIQMFGASWASRIPVNTLKQTFDYFDEKPCVFSMFPEIHTSALIFKNHEVIVRVILEPWARCALEANCSCPVAPAKVKSCLTSIENHRCHRFDQSILGVITAKLFSRDVFRVVDSDMSKYISM